MKASVVVNIHSGTDIRQLHATIGSVLDQEYGEFEIIIVVSDAPDMRKEVRGQYGDITAIKIVSLDEDDGLSAARNAGAEAATGDIVVFTDDDVTAESDWLSELVAIYKARDPVGVGGRVVPVWPDQKPWYLPNEFFWLIGAMHDNYVDKHVPQPVRNAFGCNISFNRETFLKASGFREDLGKNQNKPLQGEEAELCERLDGEFWYAPDALVRHQVDPGQLGVRYLLRRSFWQGYSKAALADDTSSESSFLMDLVTDSIPQRLASPTLASLGEIVVLTLLTGAVGLGFLYGQFPTN